MAGSLLHRTGVVPLKPLSFSQIDTPGLGRWKAYFYRRPKDNEVNDCEAVEQSA
jgi:hypothetical protein